MKEPDYKLDRVDPEQAKILKELGYDWPSMRSYLDKNNTIEIVSAYFLNNQEGIDLSNDKIFMYAAPKRKSVIEWLRKKRRAVVEINLTSRWQQDVLEYKWRTYYKGQYHLSGEVYNEEEYWMAETDAIDFILDFITKEDARRN